MYTEAKNLLIRSLRWSERYTKTDMVYLTKSGGALVISDMFLAVVGLGISILFAAYVPKEIFGIYKYVLSIGALAVAFSLSGMNTAVIRAVSRGFEGTFRESLFVQLKWSFLQALLPISVAVYYGYKDNEMYMWAFLAISILAPIASTLNTYTAYVTSKKDFGRLALWKTYGGLFQSSALAAVILFAPSVVILVATYYLATLLVNAYFTIQTFRTYVPNNKKISEENLSYGKHLSVMNAVGIFSAQVENLLIYHLLGPVSLAIYAFSILIPEKLRALLGFLPTIALPKLSEKDPSLARTSMKKKVVVATLGATCIALFYTLSAPIIFHIFFPAYVESIPYSQVAALFVLVAAPSYLMSILTAEGNRHGLYVVSTVTPIVKIILMVIGILLFGIWGALAARIISGVFQGGLLFIILRAKTT